MVRTTQVGFNKTDSTDEDCDAVFVVRTPITAKLPATHDTVKDYIVSVPDRSGIILTHIRSRLVAASWRLKLRGLYLGTVKIGAAHKETVNASLESTRVLVWCAEGYGRAFNES